MPGQNFGKNVEKLYDWWFIKIAHSPVSHSKNNMSSFFSRFVLFRDNLKLTVCSWSVNSREGQLMTKKSVRSWTNHCVRENRDQRVRGDAVNRALLGKVSFDHTYFGALTNFGRMTKLTFSFRFFGSYTLLECSQISTRAGARSFWTSKPTFFQNRDSG